MKLPKSLFISILALAYSVFADSSSADLENPGLQPLIARANGFLAAGQINDAIKALTEAIGMLRLFVEMRQVYR